MEQSTHTRGDYGRLWASRQARSYVGTQTKTRDPKPASVAAEPLAKARPAAQRQEPEAAGQSIRRIADWPQPRPGWGTAEATQEHSRTEEPEGARRRFRDIEKEQRTDAGLVTVVIPCYNQAHFLGEPIESVLTQEKTSTIGRLTRPV